MYGLMGHIHAANGQTFVFFYALVGKLLLSEFVIADEGYFDGYNYCITPTGFHSYADRQRACIRSRHETVNRRYKEWGALRQKFRHGLEKHGLVFRAITNIIQMGLETDEPLFKVHYDESEFENMLF